MERNKIDNQEQSQHVRYKIWLEIEEHDPSTDTYRNVDAPGGPIAEFFSYVEATEFVATLNIAFSFISRESD